MKNQGCKPPKKGHRPFTPITDQTIVIVSVGKDFRADKTRDFSVLQEYLTSVSDYFANTFGGAFKEAVDKTVSLGDVTPQTFAIFLEWLHGRTLRNGEGKEYDGKADGKINVKAQNAQFMELLDLYIFADEYDVPQLRRDVLDMYIKYQDDFPKLVGPETISKAYKHLSPSSMYLWFLVDVAAYDWVPSGGNTAWNADSLPREFSFGLASKFARLNALGQNPRARSPYHHLCDYHEHDKNPVGELETEE